jgi:small subunit ribosomal protein S16
MLKIKLARFGKKKQPMYRIVVNEAKSKRDGQYVALVGRYAPTESPKVLEINMKEYEAWLAKGAQPTETVMALAKRLKSGNPFPPKKAQPNRKAKAKATAEAEAKPAAAAEEPVVEPAAAS